MRNNKFMPLILALILHLIPFIFIKTNSIPFKAPHVVNFQMETIELSHFTVSKEIKNQKFSASLKEIKTVGFSATSIQSGTNEMTHSTIQGDPYPEKGPTFLSYQVPLYPPIARQKGLEGKVKIKAYYNHEGIITNVEILESSGIKILDESVKKAAYSWKIKNEVAGNFEFQFVFKLN